MPQWWDFGVLGGGGGQKLAWGFAMAPNRLRVLVYQCAMLNFMMMVVKAIASDTIKTDMHKLSQPLKYIITYYDST